MTTGPMSIGGRSCYDCGARTGLVPWSAPWDDSVPPRYARCDDRVRCKARARKARDRAMQRQGIIVLRFPPSPSTVPGECRWCGAQLRRRQDGEPARRSHCEPRYEGRNCARAWRRSRTYDVRFAILVRDLEAHGCVRCADCDVVCERKGDDEPRVAWEGDHELALEDGGKHELDNLRARCVPCHRRKTARENSARAGGRRAAAIAGSGQLSLLEVTG